MKVSDFQKLLRAFADAIGTKMPEKSLSEAADALTPFADRSMVEFATFLKLAEVKYRETGELPDGKPSKPVREKKTPTVKEPAPTAEQLLETVAKIKVEIRTDQTLTKDGIAERLKKFEKLPNPQLFACVAKLGMKNTPKTKADAFTMLVNHAVAAQSGVERSDA